MRYLLTIAIFLSLNLHAVGQNSIFEDAAGEGAFKIRDNVISINAAEKAVKLNLFTPILSPDTAVYYSPNEKLLEDYNLIIDDRTLSVPRSDTLTTVTGKKLYPGDKVRRIIYKDGFNDNWGININAIANSGMSKLFEDGKVDPTGELGVFYTEYGKNDNLTNFDYWVFSGGIKIESLTFVDTTDFSRGSFKKANFGYSFEVAYNKVGSIGSSTALFGSSVSYVVSDNADDLTAEEFTITNIIQNSNDQTITTVNSLKGFNEQSYIKDRYTLNFNIDGGIYPKAFNDRLVFTVHYRGKKFQDSDYISNVGFGAYISDQNASTKILGGINFVVEDFFGINTDESLGRRLGINLVAGFKF